MRKDLEILIKIYGKTNIKQKIQTGRQDQHYQLEKFNEKYQ